MCVTGLTNVCVCETVVSSDACSQRSVTSLLRLCLDVNMGSGVSRSERPDGGEAEVTPVCVPPPAATAPPAAPSSAARGALQVNIIIYIFSPSFLIPSSLSLFYSFLPLSFAFSSNSLPFHLFFFSIFSPFSPPPTFLFFFNRTVALVPFRQIRRKQRHLPPTLLMFSLGRMKR